MMQSTILDVERRPRNDHLASDDILSCRAASDCSQHRFCALGGSKVNAFNIGPDSFWYAQMRGASPPFDPRTLETFDSNALRSKIRPIQTQLQVVIVWRSRMPDVKVYIISWSADCVQAKQFLDDEGIFYEEIDIEVSPAAARFVESANGGRRVVPTFDVDGTVFSLKPFDWKKLQKELERLGVEEEE